MRGLERPGPISRGRGRQRRRLAAVCALTLVIVSCGDNAEPDPSGPINLAAAASYFREFDALCAEDGGQLWGVSFCGPFLFVDRETRTAVGNRPDANGDLTPRSGVFVGRLPPGVGIANTAIEWAGVRWTMLIWQALGQDRTQRLFLMAHEAFHRIQPELGLDATGELNAHLDTADGRYWLQMEWNALQTALLEEGHLRLLTIADALAFRAARHRNHPGAAQREIPLEVFEGLAEYSGMRLAGYAAEDVVAAVKAKRESETSFVRSFAYVSGPLYGYLLDGTGVEWRVRVSRDTDLAALLADALALPPAPADLVARREEVYGGPALREVEHEREREREERWAAWRAKLIDGPVLAVDLSAVSSVSFDPGKIFPFGENRIVSTSRELIAEWGRLEVSGGAILEDWNAGTAYVSLEGADERRVSGEGWSLEVAQGWSIVPADRDGDYVVRRE
jgi:hypothetical protein